MTAIEFVQEQMVIANRRTTLYEPRDIRDMLLELWGLMTDEKELEPAP